MMTLPLLIGLLFVAGLLFFAVQPLLAARRERLAMVVSADDEALENLLFEREAALAAIKDLQFDRAMGKLSEDDYRELDTRYRARAIEIIQRLDVLGAGSEEEESGADAALERWIEEAVAAARASTAATPAPSLITADLARFCTQCGRGLAVGDRFCAGCGTPVQIHSPAAT